MYVCVYIYIHTCTYLCIMCTYRYIIDIIIGMCVLQTSCCTHLLFKHVLQTGFGHRHGHEWRSSHTANLRTKILDSRGFDSSVILRLRGGIPRPIRDFPEDLSQGISVRIPPGLTNMCVYIYIYIHMYYYYYYYIYNNSNNNNNDDNTNTS